MHAKVLVTSVLVTNSLAVLLPSSASSPDPTITPGPDIELFRKQNDVRYMGWREISGEWSSLQCESKATYYETENHWRCCGTSSDGCRIARGCVSGSLIYSTSISGVYTAYTRAWYVVTRNLADGGEKWFVDVL